MKCLPVLFLVLVLTAACDEAELSSVAVEQGEFLVDIETTGELKAVQSRAVSKPRRGWSRAQIVTMAPEGSVVAEGDFLVQFDTAEAERNLEEKRNAWKDAQAQLASERASIASRMAELESQRKNQEFSFEQAKIRFEQMEYEADIRKREQELELKKAELSLDEANARTESQRIVDQAIIRKAELAVQQAALEVTKYEESLEALTLNAPIGGLVVYKEIWRNGGGRSKVQVGDSPWPGQDLIEIPDLSQMEVVTKVNEVDVNRISVGLEVLMEVDALPGETFRGNVTSVATLAQREGNSDVKTFELKVVVETEDERLRPGMTSSCRIVVDRIAEATFVPLESVFEEEGRTLCYVVSGGVKAREIELGPRNSDFVVITSGLSVGEKVSLRDPNRPLEDLGTEPPPS